MLRRLRVELAEVEVAVGDERAHAAQLGEAKLPCSPISRRGRLLILRDLPVQAALGRALHSVTFNPFGKSVGTAIA